MAIESPVYMARSSAEVFQRDIATLKAYGPSFYKLALLRSVRVAGFEERGDKGKKNTAGNTAKLEQSLSRTRSKVLELALCNSWDWFGTFTLSGDIRDRFDIQAFSKALPKFIRNMNTAHGCRIEYLLIPEQHKDGAWHMHGLLRGIPQEQLVRFRSSDGVPSKLIRGGFYNWPAYQKRFGFVSLGPVKNQTAAALYITKYITKELTESPVGLNRHLYFCSQGLRRAVLLERAPLYGGFTPDYVNDYAAVKVYTEKEAPLRLFQNPTGDALPMLFSDVNPEALNRCKELQEAAEMAAEKMLELTEEVVEFVELPDYDPDDPFADDPFGVDRYMVGRI